MICLMKKLIALTTVTIAFLSLAPSAFAQLSTCPTGPFSVLCFVSTDISDIVGAVIGLIFIVAVVVALFFLLWGAVRWIFSGGDKAAIEGARGQIVAAIVGLIILFLVFLIINVVLAFFQVNIGTLSVPTIP